ncbi:hypothetical protein L226DRAFT_40872 [Lentinus tigrinus ALCF2SS1-7]|uniref:F-box domain-containing protein n=1 Tax=Lentinus tigrinus ALCF2SS1-6 TaxID=1328759 RepID=A0A5C2STC6_9APHY|nr:hypothetical protein L227DRAFT_261210 [Lentinus tigrinus ALCF2SS1-6]RPD82912.1 hypothetical protein L226DRAFT_40872 [Lentinus tigrinus ALCF2SS1-7]
MLFTLPADLCTLPDPPIKFTGLPHRRLGHLTTPRLLRDPQTLDFERWVAYARHVQVIGEHPHSILDRVSFSPEVWATLTRYGPNPLLPNLRRLCVHGAEVQYLSNDTLHFPFAGSLRHLRCPVTSRPKDLDILDKLAKSALQLEVLDISTEYIAERGRLERYTLDSITLEKSLIPCLLTLSDLRMLRLPNVTGISPAALSAIGALRSLSELTITITDLLTPLDNGSSTLFPTLKTVRTTVDELRCVTAFLYSISSPLLETIWVSCHNHATSAAVIRFFSASAVYQQHPRLTLREIMLASKHVQPQPRCNLEEAIRPLLNLHQLASFSLFGWETLDIDNSFVAELASAWPALKTLHLRPSSDPQFLSDAAPSVTLAGLLPLASLCPELRAVSLAINVDVDVPAPELRPYRQVTESRLRELHIGLTGPPRDPVQIAAFLSDHFPWLYNVGYYPRPGASIETRRGWGIVQALRCNLSLIRWQERNWAERLRRGSCDETSS